MAIHLRLMLAAVSALAGLCAILLTLRTGLLQYQQSWLLVSIAVLTAGTLISTLGLARDSAPPEDGTETPDVASTGRQIHAEAVKILGLLEKQAVATRSFNAVLDKASAQLPASLTPDQVGLVVTYLMLENENMRARTAELQASLEKSQHQIERLKSNLAVAEAQGLTDPLTNLKNRRSFDISLAAEVAAARGSSRPLSLIMADIDHFKAINDRYGHPAGDDVLRWFAKILSNNMKGRDTVTRYGGEEFAIILPQTKLEQAAILANQIRQQLEAQLWSKPGASNTMLRITASFGVAEWQDGEGTSALTQRADAKLYESKAAGRNRVAA